MIRNILFFLTTIGALVWVVYAGSNLVNFSEKSNPEKLFGQEDGRIFILNRAQEVEIENTDFTLQPRLTELYSILDSAIQPGERIYISELKAHILLQTNPLLTEEQVMMRFLSYNFKKTGTKKYEWKDFKITYFKGIINCEIESENRRYNHIKWNSFDKKSSYSMIEFNDNYAIIKDFYTKEGSTTIYTRQPLFTEAVKGIDDQALFANYVPSMINSYQFTEKFAFAKMHPEFEKSPAFSWTNSGVVSFEYNNTNFLLMDLLDGYDPKQILEMDLDSGNGLNNNYTGISITEDFPSSRSRGFFLKQFENHVLISDKSSVLNEVEVALELGQTLGRFKPKHDLVFGESPKNVVERIWSSEQKKSTSTYNGTLIGVEIKSGNNKLKNNPDENQVKSYAMNSSIEDLLVHSSQDLVFAVGKDNTISGFSNGKNIFTQKINDGIVGSILWNKDQTKIIFTSASKLNVLSLDGTKVAGFPVEIPNNILKGATSFNWNGNENYLVASLDGKYHWINQKGEIVKSNSTEFESISAVPNAWVSANKLFFGFRSGGEFKMLDAQKGTVFRTFTLSKSAIAQTMDNEIRFYDLENGALIQYDQKGNKTQISTFKSPIWVRQLTARDNNGFCIKNSNVISCYSPDGKLLTQSKIPFESVDDLAYAPLTKKGPILGVLDGLTNQVHLYQSKGSPINLENNQAQKKIGISTQEENVILYTIIDKFVIKYVL